MTEPYLIIQLVYSIAQFFVGIMANGIIVIVSGLEFIKRKGVTAYNLLLSSLGFFRIFLQVLILVNNLIFFFTLEQHIPLEVFLFFFFINEVNLWLATCLCVFYCVKVTSIINPFFSWLKSRISRLVPWWILISLLFSSAMTVVHGLLYWPESKKELRRFLLGNDTVQDIFLHLFPVPVLVLGLIVPFFMFNAASFLLLYSLCRHTRQMRGMATGFRDPSTKAHIWAIKSIFSFLVLYSTYYFGIVILFSGVFSQRTDMLLIFFSLASLYPSGHSIILILGNSKLKHYIRKFLLSSKCCLRRGSSLDSTQTQ